MKKGWAVQIRRKDGSTFLSCGAGVLPAVFAQRKYAVGLRRNLAWSPDFPTNRTKVVPVQYCYPEVVEEKI
jgi:hypothetical protein